MKLTRLPTNPIIGPNPSEEFEARATFNPCPVVKGDKQLIVYRAEAEETEVGGQRVRLSSLGIAETENWTKVVVRKNLVSPSEIFDQYGCEDPRVTWMEGKYYIFYTALGTYPPDPDHIRVAVAISADLERIEEKHLVTPFNAKAMTLLPGKVNGNYVVIVTVDTDRPPAKVAVAFLQKLEQLWDEQFWQHWYRKLDHNTMSLLRSASDQVEVGAVVETDKGWLLIYSYIAQYGTGAPKFTVEAALLDKANPLKVIGRTQESLLNPEEEYENIGLVPRVVFPSGAIVQNGELGVFYGGADTYGCLATGDVETLLVEISSHGEEEANPVVGKASGKLARFKGNPIVAPIIEHSWENKYTLNPAAIEIGGTTYVLYRAMGTDNVSVMGMVVSKDGLRVEERLNQPVYVPREKFEMNNEGRFSGCEDARITRIGERLYMCYTAYDGVSPTHVAVSSIEVADFVNRKWNWSRPVIVSPPDRDDKNACLLPEKIDGKYILLHRFSPHIWMDTLDDLNFATPKEVGGEILMSPREKSWDSEKIGIGAPPFKTAAGWVLIYHGISKYDKQYRLGAALLDFYGVKRVEHRLEYPILEPEAWYESSGLRPGTVFTCGAVERDGTVYVYYGAADQYVGVATMKTEILVKELLKSKPN